MRTAKSRVVVKLVKLDNLPDPWSEPYLGQEGVVERIDTGAYGGYAMYVRFPDELDIKTFGSVLESGFLCYSDQVEVIEGNLNHCYYGEE